MDDAADDYVSAEQMKTLWYGHGQGKKTMKKFRCTSYVTIRVKMIQDVEAPDEDEARRLFEEEGERGELIEQQTIKLIGDEELEEVEEMK